MIPVKLWTFSEVIKLLKQHTDHSSMRSQESLEQHLKPYRLYVTFFTKARFHHSKVKKQWAKCPKIKISSDQKDAKTCLKFPLENYDNQQNLWGNILWIDKTEVELFGSLACNFQGEKLFTMGQTCKQMKVSQFRSESELKSEPDGVI